MRPILISALCTLLSALPSSAATFDMPTGVHWAEPSEYAMLKSKGIDFVVTSAGENDITRLNTILNTAKTTGMKVIAGMIQYPQAGTTAPHPYNVVSGQWTITAAGQTFLTTMKTFEASNPGVIMALFVFNEPIWVSPLTGLSDTANGCPAMTSSQLRALRDKIHTVWPQAKIFHDLGMPSFWAPGGSGYNSYACIRTMYEPPTGIADYAGIWQYPFQYQPASYLKTASLAALRNEVETFIPTQMAPAQAILLGQASDAPLTDNLRFPSFDEMKDWNCAMRTLPAAGVTWYVWDQNFYRNELSNHPDYAPADYLPAAGAAACAGAGTGAAPYQTAPVLQGGRFAFPYPNLFTGATGPGSPEGFALRFTGAKHNPGAMELWVSSGRDPRRLNPQGAYFKHINLRTLDNQQRGPTGSKIEGRPDYDWIHANHPEWILKNAAGQYITLYLPSDETLDFGNDAYLDWVLNTWMPNQLFDSYDMAAPVIYLQHDNGAFYGMQYDHTGAPIRCAVGDTVCERYTTDEGMQSAWTHMLSRLKARWPKVRIIISSFPAPDRTTASEMTVFQRIFSVADGYFSESLTDRHVWWKSLSTSQRRNALGTTLQLASWLADNGKLFMPMEGQADGIALNQADTDYAYAFFNLLRKGEQQYFAKLTTTNGNWVPANYPEMDLALGNALEAATQIQTQVYRRNFVRAIAYVNLSDSSVSITLPAGSTYTNSLGQSVNSPVVLNSFSGLTVYRPTLQASVCDVNADGATNVLDVQRAVNQALAIVTPCTADINQDGQCNVLDVQRVTNAALGGTCVSP